MRSPDPATHLKPPSPVLFLVWLAGGCATATLAGFALTAICSPFLLVLPLVIKRNNPVKEAIPSLKLL
jgi:hypothetical protein